MIAMSVHAPPEVQGKIDATISVIRELNGAVVALSAGVDSSLVAILAYRALGERAVCATGISESLPPKELDVAKATADAIGIRHVLVRTDELQNPDYYSNTSNRCFFCKETLYAELRKVANQMSMEAILDGTQVDDLADDRPGLAAARKAGVISPLLEVGFSKAEVREAARVLGLQVWDKPAMPCLSSRIVHGENITVKKLDMVGGAELYVKRLTGVKDLRVRYANAEARIEVPPGERSKFFGENIMDQIDGELRRLGFTRVTLDLRGYSGKKTTVTGNILLPMANAVPSSNY